MNDQCLPMLRSRKRMRKTLNTGRTAFDRALMILRRERTLPKSRTTRSARKIRTTPDEVLVSKTESRDMATIKASKRDQPLRNGRNQNAKALIMSSTVKKIVKARFSFSMMPSLKLLLSLIPVDDSDWDSMMVHPKF